MLMHSLNVYNFETLLGYIIHVFSFLINILCKNYMFIDIRFAVFEIVCNGKCLNVLDLKLL